MDSNWNINYKFQKLKSKEAKQEDILTAILHELWVPEQVPVEMCWVKEGQVLWDYLPGGWLGEAPGVVQQEDGKEEGR